MSENGYMAMNWDGLWHRCGAGVFRADSYTWAVCHVRSDKWQFWARELPPGRRLCDACQLGGQGLFAAQTSAAQEGLSADAP